MYSILRELPVGPCQFVAVWMYDGITWADTVKLDNQGRLYRYNDMTDDFYAISSDHYAGRKKLKYIIDEEQ